LHKPYIETYGKVGIRVMRHIVDVAFDEQSYETLQAGVYYYVFGRWYMHRETNETNNVLLFYKGDELVAMSRLVLI